MMGCAAALQASFEQRGLLDFLGAAFVGVLVPGVEVVVVGVDVPDVTVEAVGSACWRVAVMSLPMSVDDSGSVGAVPPRRGVRSWRVEEGCRLSSDTVAEGSRVWPDCSNLASAGMLVEAERNSSTLEMELVGLTLSGIAAVYVLVRVRESWT
jgi:hypothetical protein